MRTIVAYVLRAACFVYLFHMLGWAGLVCGGLIALAGILDYS